MKVALIGVGEWGKNILRNLDNIAEVSKCGYNGSKSTKKFINQNYPHITLEDNLEDIFKDKTIEAVAIATPPSTHFNLAKRAIKNGKDVFLEKPMTTSPEKSRELENLAEKNNQIVFVGYIFLYHPNYTKIESIVKKEGLEYMKAEWRKTGSFKDKISHTLICHDLAISHSLESENLSKNSITVNQTYRTNKEKTNIIDIEVDFGGFKLYGAYNRLYPEKEKSISIKTSEGNLYVWRDQIISKFDTDAEKFQEIERSTEEPLENELRKFIECIKERKKPRTDASFGRKIDSMLEKI